MLVLSNNMDGLMDNGLRKNTIGCVLITCSEFVNVTANRFVSWSKENNIGLE